MSKKEKNAHTNAMRLLDEKKIEYACADLHLSAAADAQSVAGLLGADPKAVFKTLVTRSDGKEILVFMIPATQKLSLKKAARAAGVKNLDMILQKELMPLTGYVHGGCSPLAMKKHYRTFLDASALSQKAIWFSGGKIGVQICLDPMILQTQFAIHTADLCMD